MMAVTHEDIKTDVAVLQERLDTHMDCNDKAHERLEQKLDDLVERPKRATGLGSAVAGLVSSVATVSGLIVAKLSGLL